MTAPTTASARSVDPELVQMRATFRRALIGVAAGFVLLAGLIAAFATNRDRPEGAAERWLTAVSDTTRKGVDDDARKEAGERGVAELVGRLIPSDVDFDGKGAFITLEVGQAIADGDRTRVPFEAVLREHAPGTPDAIVATAVLEREDDRWRVVAVDERRTGELLPDEGGPRLSSAPPTLYLGAVAAGIVVAALCSLVVRLLRPPDGDETLGVPPSR